MTLAPGARLGPYEIVAVLGVGGMGEVYDAYDPRLRRRVALKVLPQALAGDPRRRERFEREAQTVAALSHPNIVTIYSVEQADGVSFLTMELVEGQLLSAHVPARGMPLGRLLQIAIPLADAMSAAHARGITHRDLKPSNVLVTNDGRVKVLDFGLAKLTDHAAGPEAGATTFPTHDLTGEGRIVGTVAYMSPEQAEGRPVDQRSDLFSLGILLYELATGERPFTGDSTLSVLSSILRDTPMLVTDRHPELPPELARLIRRCLEKDPERRLQTALDLRNELEEIKGAMPPAPSPAVAPAHTRASRTAEPTSDTAVLAAIVGRHQGLVAVIASVLLITLIAVAAWRWRSGGTAANTPIDSVAVLPFVNTSGNPDVDYLSDGFTDSLTNSLAQIRSLRVAPRTLAAKYRNKTVDPQQAGHDLNVRAVVTGHVVQRGDRFQIQAELIDVVNVAQLWGEQFDRKVSDVLSVEREVAKAIAEKLRQRLTHEDEKSLTAGTSDATAYELYLRAQFEFGKRNANGLARATDYFEQAIVRDPSYALAYVGVSRAYATRAFLGYLAPGEGFPKAIAAGRKAVELDERSAEAHAALGAALINYDWTWVEPEREFQRALALDPDNANVHYLYGGFFLPYSGRFDAAIGELARAEALDPISAVIPARTGLVQAYARRLDDASATFRRVLAAEPDFVMAHRYFSLVHRLQGMGDLAIAESRRQVDLGDPNGRADLAQGYAMTGRRADAEKLLKELVDEAAGSAGSAGQAVAIASVFVALGNADAALTWLERGYKERDPNMISLGVAPEFDGLRADSRFSDLVRRIGIPQAGPARKIN